MATLWHQYGKYLGKTWQVLGKNLGKVWEKLEKDLSSHVHVTT